MKKTTVIMVAAVCSMMVSGIALAAPTDDAGIQKHETKQEKRIQKGIKSGKLTPQEAADLEAKQAQIKKDEAAMKADGKLTNAERKKLKQEQSKASKEIYKNKHDKDSVPAK